MMDDSRTYTINHNVDIKSSQLTNLGHTISQKAEDTRKTLIKTLTVLAIGGVVFAVGYNAYFVANNPTCNQIVQGGCN